MQALMVGSSHQACCNEFKSERTPHLFLGRLLRLTVLLLSNAAKNVPVPGGWKAIDVVVKHVLAIRCSDSKVSACRL
jgi:hypothetical protein